KVQGYNEIREAEKTPLWKRFAEQLTDPLIIVLIVAAVVSVVVDPSEWTDSAIIGVVVLFNAVLGVYQESNAEKSLEALKQMASPKAKVIRDGKRMDVESRDLVCGDIVVLEAGDLVPSDGRLLEAAQLQIDESALTGESVPVTKTSETILEEEVALGDQKNMVFASTICTYGRGKYVVTSIGMENEVGKIAGMLMVEGKEVTPLQEKLAQISKTIGLLCMGICAAVFVMEKMTGLSTLEAFKTAVALAVAAIPEGLATVVTIVLALGVTKMVKKHAIVRKLPAVETLGSCSIICSDKTGTLTQNRMTVVKTYTKNTGLQDFDANSSPDLRTMLSYFSLCSDGVLTVTEKGIELLGDPTETALVAASYQFGDTKQELAKQFERCGELAFDSDRKMMTVFFKISDGILQITKGAPDVIVSRCVGNTEGVLDANEQMADSALRVLACGVRYYPEMPDLQNGTDYETNLTFVGLVGMIDPPRLEVKDAIREAKSGGIKTVMITGDHLVTARAIARELGIYEEGDEAITGAMLNAMSDEELEQRIPHISVYARVAPEHKVRIVSMWQKIGQVVAMTGDGVNDSPALKKADIGCAMGITGTDVAKSAADMVLTDDNFATIIAAVKEGRGIYANIKKDVQFLLSSNIGEVLLIFGASLIQLVFKVELGVPLLPIHLLWVNLITDSLPAFALGLEEPEDGIMNEKPRDKQESFFANGLGITIAWQGLLVGALSLISYMTGNAVSHETGMSMAFVTLSLTQLVHAFNIKSKHTIFHPSTFNNKFLWLSLVAGLVLVLGIMYIPACSSLFKLVPLGAEDLFVALGLPFVMVVACEIQKKFQ
ncbi:MAG: cation-translocating P-type ATPase, partial [Erysipelotrichaceae bacterium]|nr:cation-translocating P-type ATPase [Erysipelotrichaceae bacterium]